MVDAPGMTRTADGAAVEVVLDPMHLPAGLAWHTGVVVVAYPRSKADSLAPCIQEAVLDWDCTYRPPEDWTRTWEAIITMWERVKQTIGPAHRRMAYVVVSKPMLMKARKAPGFILP